MFRRAMYWVCLPLVVLTVSAARPQGDKQPEGANPDDYLWLLKYEKTKAKLSPEFQKLLDKLQKSKVPSLDAAAKAANQWKFQSGGGLVAQETTKVIGLVRLGVPVPQFGHRGDLVWVVRFYHPADGATQEIWVNSTGGEVRALLPVPEKK